MTQLLSLLCELLFRTLQIPLAATLDRVISHGWWRRFPWIIRGYSLSGRYCNRVSSELLSSLQRLCAEQTISHLQITSTGVLQCFSAEQVFLLPCGDVARSSLDASYCNWVELKRSEWAALVEYRFSCLGQGRLYSMELLKPASRNPDGVGLLSEQACAPLQSLSAFDWGGRIDHLAAFCDVHAFNSLLQCSEQVPFGLVHGDLHPGNVMENVRSQRVLIDLDRMCLFAPLFIDQIHLRVCALEQLHGCSWLVVLTQRLFEGGDFSRHQLLGYIVFRAAAENQQHCPGVRYRRRLLAALRSVN